MSEIFTTLMSVMESGSLLSYIIILSYGLLIGSFLNVVIYRLPVMMNLDYIQSIKDGTELPDEVLTSKMSIKEKEDYYKMLEMKGMTLSIPRSRCGSCGYKIPVWHNIPVFSYIFLRGKCNSCKQSYSPRYLLIEALIGLVFCFSFYTFGATTDFLLITGVVTALIASFFIDLDHKLLPDSITFSSLFAGLFYNITSTNGFVTAESSIYGAVFGFLIIYSAVKGYEKLRNIGMMMGDGDLKLYAMCGAWFGLYNLTFIIVLSTLIGLLQFVVLTPFVKNIKEFQLPFGPSILIVFFAFIFFNNYMLGFINYLGF